MNVAHCDVCVAVSRASQRSTAHLEDRQRARRRAETTARQLLQQAGEREEAGCGGPWEEMSSPSRTARSVEREGEREGEWESEGQGEGQGEGEEGVREGEMEGEGGNCGGPWEEMSSPRRTARPAPVVHSMNKAKN